MRPYAPRSAASGPSLQRRPPAPPQSGGASQAHSRARQREAQRRLNHSIIEKARRTKINDALAALKQLVPATLRQDHRAVQDQLDEEDDNDDDYEEGKAAKPQPAAGKGKGKKEEKEKEFKLEILIRTVSFLQDLLQRVDVLESAAARAAPPEQAQSAPVAAAPAPPSQIMNCPSCNAPLNAPRRRLQGKKRKRAPVGRQSDGYSSDDDDRDDRAADDGGVDVFSPPRPLSSTAPPPARRSKNRPEVDGAWAIPDERARDHHHHQRSAGDGRSACRAAGLIRAPPPLGRATAAGTPAAVSARLPPISAWLECVLDPQLPGAPSRSPPSEARRPSASPHLGAISNANVEGEQR